MKKKQDKTKQTNKYFFGKNGDAVKFLRYSMALLEVKAFYI